MKPMKSVYTIYFLVSVIFAFGQLRICVLHIKFVLAVCILFFWKLFSIHWSVSLLWIRSIAFGPLKCTRFLYFFLFLRSLAPLISASIVCWKSQQTFNYFFFVPITMGIVFIWGFSLNSLVIINGFLSVRVQNTSMYIFFAVNDQGHLKAIRFVQ